MKPLSLLLLLLLLGSPVHAESGGADWLRRHAEGWFWYQDPIQRSLNTVEEPPETAPPTPSAPDSPPPFSAAWLRDQIPVWQDRALDDPTGEATMIHALLERLAYAKADAFQQARMAMRYSDPFLDGTSGMPVSTGGVRMARQMASDGQEEVLTELAGRAGLWFFFESSCPYCARQVIALQQLAGKYGFEVLAISIDGAPLPNWPDDYVVDVGQSELLGVERWPAIFLARPPAGFAQVSTGLVSLPELEKRLISVAHLHGWIDDAARDRTRPAQGRDARYTELGDTPLSTDGDNAALIRTLKQLLGEPTETSR